MKDSPPPFFFKTGIGLGQGIALHALLTTAAMKSSFLVQFIFFLFLFKCNVARFTEQRLRPSLLINEKNYSD